MTGKLFSANFIAMFDPVDSKQSFPALEAGILKYWKEEDTFKRSIRHRSVKRMDALEGRVARLER